MLRGRGKLCSESQTLGASNSPTPAVRPYAPQKPLHPESPEALLPAGHPDAGSKAHLSPEQQVHGVQDLASGPPLPCSKPLLCYTSCCYSQGGPAPAGERFPHSPPLALDQAHLEAGALAPAGPRRWDWLRAGSLGLRPRACGLSGEAAYRAARGTARLVRASSFSGFPGHRQTCSGSRMTPQPTTAASCLPDTPTSETPPHL